MFRHISGHLHVHNWSLKRTDIEIYMLFLPQYVNCELGEELK